jgi:dephospho-CoA kinase
LKVLGLTGGIGMGKSTVAELLRQRGLPVVDTDLLAREVVAPGQPAVAELRAAFGDGVFDASGTLDREALARVVFADDAARRRLEAILHPRIRAAWEAQVVRWRAEGRAAGVVVIPLLFETGAQSAFDAILCVACTAATQHQRLRDRGWSDKQIEQRLQAQWPIERKLQAADFVIWTEGDLASVDRQCDAVLG